MIRGFFNPRIGNKRARNPFCQHRIVHHVVNGILGTVCRHKRGFRKARLVRHTVLPTVKVARHKDGHARIFLLQVLDLCIDDFGGKKLLIVIGTCGIVQVHHDALLVGTVDF